MVGPAVSQAVNRNAKALMDNPTITARFAQLQEWRSFWTRTRLGHESRSSKRPHAAAGLTTIDVNEASAAAEVLPPSIKMPMRVQNWPGRGDSGQRPCLGKGAGVPSRRAAPSGHVQASTRDLVLAVALAVWGASRDFRFEVYSGLFSR